jgi:Tfp pilus assembly protein PilN
MRAVNLLPRDERRRKTTAEQLPLIVGVAAFAVVLLALAGGYLWTSSAVSKKEAAREAAKRELAGIPAPPPPPSPVEAALPGEQRARISAVSSALSKRVAWDRVLRELSLVLPEDVWLTSLAAKSPSSPASAAPAAPAAPGAPPTGLTINGYTYSHAGVARLLSRLLVVPDLENVQLQSSTLSRVGTQRIVAFTILADVKAPGAAS